MHGAIVADALRIPWVAALPIDGINRNKWFDWADSLDITLQPYRIWPSSLVETGLVLARRPILRRVLQLLATPIADLAERTLIRLAARRLKQAAGHAPSLSSEEKISSVTGNMLLKLEELQADYPVAERFAQTAR